MKALKAQGRICGIVEKYNAHALLKDKFGAIKRRGVRQDLFGIIDIIALDFERGVVGVQSTGSDFSGHHKKLTGEKRQACINWLRTPGAVLELWGWRKLKQGKRDLWQPRIRVYTLDDFFDPLA